MDLNTNKLYSGEIVGRDFKTGRFLNGHKKVGGRRIGSLNFNTKALRIIENMNYRDLEKCADRDLLIKSILKMAIEGRPTTSLSTTIFLFNLLDGPQ